MRFFFDNNIGLPIVRGLHEFGEDVCHLTQHFAANEQDAVWLAFVGSQGMYLITKDDKIRRHPSELEALKGNRVGAFYLTGHKMDRWGQIKQIVRAWEKIKETAAAKATPFVFRVNASGTNLDRIPLP